MDADATTSGTRPPLRFGVVHDFRSPPGSGIDLGDVYAQTMEQIVLLDGLGLDQCWFSEHHFVPDSYLPNFVPVAAAAAARTSRLRFSTDVCLLPFVHPLRLAEDLGILDQLSGGRMELGIGLGYAVHEFRAFGVPIRRRVSLTEEGIEILRLAWTGERFSYYGRRYQFDDVLVTPQPVQAGGPPLWLASSSRAGAERAVRYGTHLLPQGDRAEVLDPWRAGVHAAGGDPAERRVGVIRSVLVTDDAERDWAVLKQAEQYRMGVYLGFAEEAERAGTPGGSLGRQERIPQRFIVGDVEHCVAELVDFITTFGFTDVVTWGSAPSLEPVWFTPSMERFTTEVVPRVRAALEPRG
jgi:alkanesulfonate monooxygenase SsuD/methylene tetrahydromethanopterin reductase-like flavin-dependent oxidoreductase (luciferase family)